MAPPSWSFDFVPHGTRLQPPLDDGTVALDVGNGTPEEGIYDHHRGGEAASCTAELAFHNRSLLKSQLTGPPNRSVFLHENPDLDALSSFFLAWTLISQLSSFESRRLRTLIDFAGNVDQGRIRPTDSLTLYTFVLMAGPWLETDDGRDFRASVHMEHVFEDGNVNAEPSSADACTAALTLRLLRDWHAGSGWAPSDPIAPEDVSSSLRPILSSLETRLSAQMDRCAQDIQRAEAVGDIGWMKTPMENDEPSEVPYVRVVDPHANPGILGKYLRTWSQQEYGAPVVSLLQFRDARRTVVSVPPESTLTLKGLGLYLERLEQQERTRQDIADDEPPRYQAADADGTVHVDPLFPGSDPWYDGRGHNFTIVDAPRSGSLLSLEQVYRSVVNAEWIGYAERYESSSYRAWEELADRD